jgi:excinuclease UvrABC nuclease subunit
MATTVMQRAGAKKKQGGLQRPVRANGLQMELRRFATSRPHGWNHDDWMALLTQLRSEGHDVEDAECVGNALERERLAVVLSGVPGLGPRRIDAIVNRFTTIWRLSQAEVTDLVALRTIPRSLAERTLDTVRQRQF